MRMSWSSERLDDLVSGAISPISSAIRDFDFDFGHSFLASAECRALVEKHPAPMSVGDAVVGREVVATTAELPSGR